MQIPEALTTPEDSSDSSGFVNGQTTAIIRKEGFIENLFEKYLFIIFQASFRKQSRIWIPDAFRYKLRRTLFAKLCQFSRQTIHKLNKFSTDCLRKQRENGKGKPVEGNGIVLDDIKL